MSSRRFRCKIHSLQAWPIVLVFRSVHFLRESAGNSPEPAGNHQKTPRYSGQISGDTGALLQDPIGNCRKRYDNFRVGILHL